MAEDVRAGADGRVTARRGVGAIDLRRRSRLGETIIQAIPVYLRRAVDLHHRRHCARAVREALLFFALPEVTWSSFFTTTNWQPSIGEFGILPLLNATLMTSLIAMLVALPLGLGAAIYLSEYATPSARASAQADPGSAGRRADGGLRLLRADLHDAAAARDLRPGHSQIYNMASAGLVMGIMILPLIASMSEDALSAVPRALREGAYGLGATRLETAMQSCAARPRSRASSPRSSSASRARSAKP